MHSQVRLEEKVPQLISICFIRRTYGTTYPYRFLSNSRLFLSGQRPKASDPSMNDWLKRDPAYRPSEVIGYEELIEDFREAYIRQSELRYSIVSFISVEY